MRILYRVKQFWHTHRSAPSVKELEEAQAVLSPVLMTMFLQMKAGDQYHSLEIFKQLKQQGENPPELLEAALLHDVGKIRCPLFAWERALIVVGQFLFPKLSKKWGNPLHDPLDRDCPTGWRRCFVVAEKHPEWGAEMVAQAGAAPLTVALIRSHQEMVTPDPYLTQPSSISAKIQEEQLLRRLQWLDNHH